MKESIYFVSASGHIKIGITRNIERRLKHIGTHLLDIPVLLGTCDGSLEIERAIHARLKDFRVHGEWFKDCPAVRAVMAEHLKRQTRDWLYVSKPRVRPGLLPAPAERHPRVVRLLAMAQKRWPERTAANMAAAVGTSVRACNHWLSGRNEPSPRMQQFLERVLA